QARGNIIVLKIYNAGDKSTILGGLVTKVKIKNNTLIKIIREEKQIGEGKITQLQHNKKNVDEVGTETECGLKLESGTTIKENDIFEIYVTEEKEKKLE
ncbi:MAG: translation initiation factor IF-2, partial [Patescibacteria group bacterium]